MTENYEEKKEALSVLSGFNTRLIGNMEIAADELCGSRKDDTDQLVKSIADAVNWEIQVLNSTMDMINQDEEKLDKEAFNAGITGFADALRQGNDQAIADAIRGMLPQFRRLDEIVKELLR